MSAGHDNDGITNLSTEKILNINGPDPGGTSTVKIPDGALFQNGVDEFIPPRKGQKHALRIVREVLARAEGADKPYEEAAGETGFWRKLGNHLRQKFERFKLRSKHQTRQTNIAQALE